MSSTNVIVGAKGNPKAAMALSSLIHALFELDSYALARLVKKKDTQPLMVVLAPFIDAEFECLVDVEVGLNGFYLQDFKSSHQNRYPLPKMSDHTGSRL